MPKQTPFHERTSALCEGQSWVEWSGYLSADAYELDHMHEYYAVRSACGLFDISPLYKYLVRGRDASALLDRMVTRDMSKCRVGQVVYTTWCDDRGKIVDDGTIARLGDDSYRLTSAIPAGHWLEDVSYGMQVSIEDVSEGQAALALQGPTSRALLQHLTGANLDELRYFHLAEVKVAGAPVVLSRTGYTGDLGYELFFDPADAHRVWDALIETGESYTLRPAGNIALDMLRIEAGLILIDAEFTSSLQTFFEVEKTTPFELGLDWVVKLKKNFFIGQRALREEAARGRAFCTVGIEVDCQALELAYQGFGMPLILPYQSWVEAVPLYCDDGRRQHIGRATSGTWSPILKKYVALARLKPERAALGSKLFIEMTIQGQRFAIPATVVETPFFNPARKRA